MGGRCTFVDEPARVYEVAAGIAQETNGHYLDQFTNAERATDWRGNNNIAESIFRQMAGEPHSTPQWVVMSAGTGGTAATIGRYIRFQNLSTRLCVADVENSVFFDAYENGDAAVTSARPSRIEGVGRPRVEPSFVPGVIDCMLRVPDAASIAAAHVLSERLFRRVGGSTGTNFMALLWIAARMLREGRQGSLVTLICDSGDRYASTYYDPDWLAGQGMDIAPLKARIESFLDTGTGLEYLI
jgi:cysteine synthase A